MYFAVEKKKINKKKKKILQWILTKLNTYLVLRRVWNPIDFQGQRSMTQVQIFTA